MVVGRNPGQAARRRLEAERAGLPAIQRGNAASGTALFNLEQVASCFGVTTARIQQIEQKALEKIRREVIREARAAGVSPEEWILGG